VSWKPGPSMRIAKTLSHWNPKAASQIERHKFFVRNRDAMVGNSCDSQRVVEAVVKFGPMGIKF